MIVYAESSGVLAWLLGETRAGAIRDGLAAADSVVASDLTLVECDRVLIRAAALGELPEADAAARRAELMSVSTQWTVLRLSEGVIDRARRPFPKEPIRTLDALHLAAALMARASLPELEILSLDQHVRANARALGFAVQPED